MIELLILFQMNIMRYNFFGYRPTLIGLMLAVLMFAACDRSRTDKGYDYFPDMFRSAAYKTYADHPVLEGGKTMLEPPEGSIPRGFMPYAYEATFEGRQLAGKELKNPYAPDEQLLAEGKNLYGIFCISCHGAGGQGDGLLITSGKYPIRPSSLVSDEIKLIPSGEIFHVITKGWGVMGAHATLIRHEDRWKIVMFVEELLQQQ
jgi:mono/diheme cytochrome c family protein